jgi:nucleotidyltransferase/DNA polymerase involved in DNA repair
VFKRLRDYVGRGVITTATYEARAFGVGSAMGMMKAAKLAPDAILLPATFDAYRHYSRLFKEAVASIAPDIEDRGIDEIFVDLTEVPGRNAGTGRAHQAGGAGRHRADLFDRRHAQQAAVENLFRPGEAQRPDRAGL